MVHMIGHRLKGQTNPADIGIEGHSSAQDHNDVTDQKATKRDADIDIGFRPFTDISVQKNK